MRLKSLFLSFSFCFSILFVAFPAYADTPREAVQEAVASSLGNAMREMGLEISGGSLPAIEHMFSNWENLKNPCGNAIKLIRAFMRDSNKNSLQYPTGIHFANTMMNTFDLPRTSAATLAAQGEIVSSKLWGNYKLQRKLRDLIRKISRICNPPKPKPQVSLPPTTGGITASGGGSVTQPPRTPPKPPVTKPPRKPPVKTAPKPKPKPVTPPPPPEPDWSVDNPCPECQPIADDLADEKEKLKKLKIERGKEAENLGANQAEQASITEEIATIKAVVDAQKGTGGSSYDPATGTTISSVNIGGGTVRVTTTDKYGNSTSYPRQTSSSKRAKKKIKKLEKRLKKIKEEEKKLKEKIKDLDTKIAASEGKVKALQTALENCIKEKCKKGGDPENLISLPGGGTPVSGEGTKTACTPSLSNTAIELGPKSELGTGFNKFAEDATKKLIGGALGGVFGGLTGGGGGEDSDTPSPKKGKDPVKKKQTFTIPGTKIKVAVGAKFDDDGKLLVSTKIKKAPGKGTIHDITLHNIGCQQMRPIEYYIWDLYAKWNISVQYTETTTTKHYVDGQLVRTDVSTEQSDWMDYASGTEHIASGKIPKGQKPETNAFPGIWKLSGFNRATSGNKGVGVKFNTNYYNFSDHLMISAKYTMPNEDPVTAIPLNLMTCPQEDGKIELIPLREYMSLKRQLDGGSVSIDPPTLDLTDHNTPDQMVDSKTVYPEGVGKFITSRGGSAVMINRLRTTCPTLFEDKVPKWFAHEEADIKREYAQPTNEDGTWTDPNQAGDDFMNAFINAFGAQGPNGKSNIDRYVGEDWDPYFDDF